MGYWKFILPEATTNLFTDPSFALADPDTQWTIAGAGADFTRETNYTLGIPAFTSYYGFSCAQMNGVATGDIYQTVTVTATSYTLSAMVRRNASGVPTSAHTRAYFDSAAADWDSITHVGGNWYLCVKTGTAAAGARDFGVRCAEAGMNVDGLQLENKAYRTTYCDGTREGCYWTGAANTSTSSRSAQSRAGGRIYDFDDDFSFEIVDWQGWGVPSTLIGLDSYAIAPGAQVNSIMNDVNLLTLTGYFQGSSLANLHSLRQTLVEYLMYDRYPQTSEGWQPIRIWYTGAETWKEAKVFYDSGLEGSSMVGNAFTEKIPVRFLMADPYWYEIGDSGWELDEVDSVTTYYATARLRSTGGWDDLGLTAVPATGGTIYAICPSSSGLVYYGGNFTHWNNIAEHDYLVAYNPATDAWDSVGAHNDFNGIVYDIKEGPDGLIYACGAFTDCHAVAAADYIAVWDGTAWAAVGAPVAGAAAITSARAMAFDSVGDLYVVGEFTNWADVAAADYVAKWDMSAGTWGAVGTPSVGAGFPYCIDVDSQDNIVVGGTFTNFAGVDAADYIARWNGTAWADLGSGTQTGDVLSVKFSIDDVLYLAGSFTNQGGDANCDYICSWNGAQFGPMVGGNAPTSAIHDIDIAPDGRVFVADTTTFRVKSWNGSAWENWDTSAYFYTIAIGRADPVVSQNYDIWAGTNDTYNALVGASNTITNDGTASQYPIITIGRDGTHYGTMYAIRNETTGKMLMFNVYTLLDGEIITIDCRPGKKSVVSSFFGPRPDLMLPNCDFGTFALQPGSNQIVALVEHGAVDDILTYIISRDAYRGMD